VPLMMRAPSASAMRAAVVAFSVSLIIDYLSQMRMHRHVIVLIMIVIK
jgi:hypothetical protein